jgi:hypothetical protein
MTSTAIFSFVRSFANLTEFHCAADEFYGAQAWREGPREALVPCIGTCVDTLPWLTPSSIDDLRDGSASPN